MVVTCQQMADAEAALFETGVSAEPYMDEAGRRCAESIRQFFPAPADAVVYCGKGNNGGDALVIARWLRRWGWQVELMFSHGANGLSELGAKKLAEFEAEPIPLASVPGGKDLVIVDGLLGIGRRGELRGPIATQAKQLNALRKERRATCFAIDLPSGLNGDAGSPATDTVIADYTLSICQPKQGFAADDATNHLGRLVEIPLDIPVTEGNEEIRFLFPSNLLPRLPLLLPLLASPQQQQTYFSTTRYA